VENFFFLLIGAFFFFALGFSTNTIIRRRYNALTNSSRLRYEEELKRLYEDGVRQYEAGLRQEERLQHQQRIIASVLHNIHHNSAISNIKTLLGLLSIYRLEVSSLVKRLKSLGKTSWGAAIEMDFRSAEDNYLTMIEVQAKEAEQKILKAVEPLNDLQD
jgi:hypothetical protein